MTRGAAPGRRGWGEAERRRTCRRWWPRAGRPCGGGAAGSRALAGRAGPGCSPPPAATPGPAPPRRCSRSSTSSGDCSLAACCSCSGCSGSTLSLRRAGSRCPRPSLCLDRSCAKGCPPYDCRQPHRRSPALFSSLARLCSPLSALRSPSSLPHTGKALGKRAERRAESGDRGEKETGERRRLVEHAPGRSTQSGQPATGPAQPDSPGEGERELADALPGRVGIGVLEALCDAEHGVCEVTEHCLALRSQRHAHLGPHALLPAAAPYYVKFEPARIRIWGSWRVQEVKLGPREACDYNFGLLLSCPCGRCATDSALRLSRLTGPRVASNSSLPV
eukprot:1805212-Rhodomonas_salina.1